MVSKYDYVLKFAGDKKAAQKLGAFYTPPQLGRRMVDKISQSFVGKRCLDNCCGYGNLVLQILDAKVRQGEDPTKALTEVYGNEFVADNLRICMRNLKIWAKLNGARWIDAVMKAHFHTGDALTDEAYSFEDPDVDVESAPDENDIVDIMLAEKGSTASFVFRCDGFSIEYRGRTAFRRGSGRKLYDGACAALAALKSKGVIATASAKTIHEWKAAAAKLGLHAPACMPVDKADILG